MTVRDIAYVELYMKDKSSAVEYFVSAMGFTRVADSVEVDRSSVLLRQNGIQLAVTSGWGTWRFLDQHGEGVADVAVTCEDVAATRAAAVRAGAAVTVSPQGNPVVSAPGGTRHTLVPAPAVATTAPPGRRWTATPAAPSAPGGRLRRLDHVLVRLPQGAFADYAAFCCDAFGFARTSVRRLDLGGRAVDSAVVRGGPGRAAFVLSAPAPGPDGAWQAALPWDGGGPGVPGLAFLVDDILPAVRDMRERGVRFLPVPDPGTRPDAVPGPRRREGATTQDPDVWAHHDAQGLVLQSLSRPPLGGQAFSLQLVQRLGSEGFGGVGVRALYEAAERGRLTAR